MGYTLVVEDRFGQLTDEYGFDSGEVVAGRSRECDIVLSSENVSRRHAKIYATPDGLFVEDLRSANGVYVNGERIEGPRELKDQDVIRVGDFHVHVRGARAALEVERPVHLRLLGRNLGVQGQTFEVTAQTTLIGRGKDCGLVLVDGSVSRVHARLLVRPDGTILVEDVGSANGLFVNDQRVKVWEIAAGDLLRVGNVEFLLDIPGADTNPGLRRRGPRLFNRKLAWVAASAAGIALVAALILALPRILSQDGGSLQEAGGPAASESAAVQEAAPVTPAPAVDPDRLAKAKSLLAGRKVEEAGREVAAILGTDPANGEAIRLSNRIEMEKAAARALADADAALGADRMDAAVQALVKVPADSAFADAAKERFRRIAPRLDTMRDKACKVGRTIKCIQFRGLAKMVQDRL